MQADLMCSTDSPVAVMSKIQAWAYGRSKTSAILPVAVLILYIAGTWDGMVNHIEQNASSEFSIQNASVGVELHKGNFYLHE